MTLTTLEPTTIEHLDFDPTIQCEKDGCSADAEYIVETFCCPRFQCERCVAGFKALITGCIGWRCYCCRHPDIEVDPITKVSDVIFSVDPL
jgi:hypothetical protein